MIFVVKKKNKLLDFMRKPYIYIYTVTISHKDNKILALLSAFEKEEINLPKILAINTLYDYTYTSTCLQLSTNNQDFYVFQRVLKVYKQPNSAYRNPKLKIQKLTSSLTHYILSRRRKVQHYSELKMMLRSFVGKISKGCFTHCTQKC